MTTDGAVMKYVRFERAGTVAYGIWEKGTVKELAGALFGGLFLPDEILSCCSRYVTLLPGDVIFTGTPGQTQAVRPGDTIEVEIESIGVLRNTVATQELPR